MKNPFLRLLALAIAAGFCFPASAQFSSQLSGLAGLSGEGNYKGNKRDIDAELKAFIEDSTENHHQVFNALRAIRIAYEDADGTARETAVTRSVNAMTDPDAQKARMESVKKFDLAAIAALKNSTETLDRTRKLESDRQRQIERGLENFLLAAARAEDLIKRGQSIIRYVSLNRLNMATVAPIKEAIPGLTDTKDAAAIVFPELIKILKAANLQVRQATVTQKSE